MPSSGGPDAVIDNPAEHRFEAGANGGRGRLMYRREGQRLVLAHTVVPEALRSQGQGGRLVAAAVEAAVAGSLIVVPECSFAYSWLQERPEVEGRVKIEWPVISPERSSNLLPELQPWPEH